MYYAEEVVNGVLCWRDTPDGKWNPFTTEQLTLQLMATKRALVLSELRIEELENPGAYL